MSREDIRREALSFLMRTPLVQCTPEAEEKVGNSVDTIVGLFEAIQGGDEQQEALLRETKTLLRHISSISVIGLINEQLADQILQVPVREGAEMLKTHINMLASILPDDKRIYLHRAVDVLYEAIAE